MFTHSQINNASRSELRHYVKEIIANTALHKHNIKGYIIAEMIDRVVLVKSGYDFILGFLDAETCVNFVLDHYRDIDTLAHEIDSKNLIMTQITREELNSFWEFTIKLVAKTIMACEEQHLHNIKGFVVVEQADFYAVLNPVFHIIAFDTEAEAVDFLLDNFDLLGAVQAVQASIQF